jgi:hypothetical protein
MEARLVDRLLRAWEETPGRHLLLRAIEDALEAEALDALEIPPERWRGPGRNG